MTLLTLLSSNMEIHRGENLIIRIVLTQQNGNPLNLSDLISLKAEIVQLRRTVVTYILGEDAEIREGNTANEVEIELIKAVTSKLRFYPVSVKLTIEAPNAEFEVDPYQVDVAWSDLFDVV